MQDGIGDKEIKMTDLKTLVSGLPDGCSCRWRLHGEDATVMLLRIYFLAGIDADFTREFTRLINVDGDESGGQARVEYGIYFPLCSSKEKIAEALRLIKENPEILKEIRGKIIKEGK